MRDEKQKRTRQNGRDSIDEHLEKAPRARRERVADFDDIDEDYQTARRKSAAERSREEAGGTRRRADEGAGRAEPKGRPAGGDPLRGRTDKKGGNGASNGEKKGEGLHVKEGKRPGERRKGGDPESLVHQITPYAMFWIALFSAVSFILRDFLHADGAAGALGSWLANLLCGLFGVIAYSLPFFWIVLSLRWKRLVLEHKLAKKLILSTSFVLLLSGIVHVFQESSETRGDLYTAASALYHGGVAHDGGGFFGGFVGEWLGYTLRLPGTILLAIPLLLLIGIYLIGMTPSGIWQRISCKVNILIERRRERRRALYDGEEAPRARAPKRSVQAVQPEGRENHRQHFAFREDEEPERELQKPVKGEGVRETVDIPEDPVEAEKGEARPEGRRTVDPELEAMLKEMMATARGIDPAPAQDTPSPAPITTVIEQTAPRTYQVTTAQPATVAQMPPVQDETEEEKREGEYYAPFALPIRPEPKREGTAAGEGKTLADEGQKGGLTVGGLGSGIYHEAPHTPVAAATAFAAGTASTSTTTQAPAAAAALFTAEPGEEILGDRRNAPKVGDPSDDPFSAFAPRPQAGEAEQTAPLDELLIDEEVRDIPTTGSLATSFAFFDDAEPSAPEQEVESPAPVPTPAPAKGMRLTFEDDLLPEDDEAVEELSTEELVDILVHEVGDGDAKRVPGSINVFVENVRPEPARSIPTPPPPAPREYRYPKLELLNEDTNQSDENYAEDIRQKVEILRETLASFNVRVKDDVECSRGPTITRYELRPEAGVSVRQVINRAEDISLNLAAPVRIEAPIPGKPAIGIEVPNAVRETVFMRTMLESEAFQSSKKPLEVPLGAGIGGDVCMCNIAAMPHLLVAGTTGSGKSVCINTILMGLMYKTSPKDLKLILIDPKQVEFTAYEHAPHLYAPVVTDSQRAVGVLACAVQEMERRYSLIRDVGVRDIDGYNKAVANDPEREHLPRMVIVIDEFADLKMSCTNNDPENFTCRLAQKARAAGMHLIIGTQRPSVDVITGKLKTNISSRIAFTVKQQVDSRTILDANGAEALTGRGDMLYLPIGAQKPYRVQGAFVSDEEVERVMDYIRMHNEPVQYNQAFMDQIEAEMARSANQGRKGDDFGADFEDDEDGEDPVFRDAVRLAIETQKVATSLLQRRLSIGYGRAAKLIDRMEELGYVSAPEGNKARKVLISPQQYAALMMNGADDSAGFEDRF